MMRASRVARAAVLTLALASPPAAAQAPAESGPCKVVVLSLVGRALPKADEELPLLLTETLANEVGDVSGCGVVAQTEIVAMLDYEKTKAVCTDGSDSCLAEIGAALGAERVVSGSVGKLGGEYILNARLMNVRKGSVESRAELVVSGPPEQLRRAAKNAGRRLFNVEDLPADAKVDASPLRSAPVDEPRGPSPLLLVGAGVGVVGLVGAIVGGALAGFAEARLSDAAERNKQQVLDQGRVALGVAAVGVVALVVGGALVGVSMME